MITRWPRTTSAALFCLLAFAGSASAECAWVLWYEHDVTVFGPSRSTAYTWGVVEASATLGSCQSNLAAKIKVNSKAEQTEVATSTVEVNGNIIFKRYHRRDDGTTTMSESLRYVCLPDTVDPRGPKGK